MAMTESDKIKFVSPLDVRHFLLDVPVTKKEYQLNAVKFALKSLYPGNEDVTSFDYSYVNKTVIGIAAASKKVTSLIESNEKIFSPTLYVVNLVKEGLIVSISDEWFEIIQVEKSELKYIKTFLSVQKSVFLEEIQKVLGENKDLSVTVCMFEDSKESFIQEFFLSQNIKYSVVTVNESIENSALNKSQLFCEKKENNILIKVFILIVVISLLLFDFFLYKSAKKEKLEYESVRKEYNELKKDSSKQVEDVVIIKQVSEEIPLYDFFAEIYKCAGKIRILSANIDNKNFKFEAENGNAIKVLKNMNDSVFFEDVVLHQAIPQEDGSEKFVISGKIKND